MAMHPTRLEFRVSLSHVDRGRDVSETLYLARHPSETQAHVILRLLSWCLLNEDGLAFGPGLSTPDAADLWTRDATGRLTTWIEAGTATAERLRKSLQHHSGAQAHIVLDDERAATELAAELADARWPRSCPPPILWVIEAALVTALAAHEDRRQRWAITIVGDHFYVDLDPESATAGDAPKRAHRTLDGAVTRR